LKYHTKIEVIDLESKQLIIKKDTIKTEQGIKEICEIFKNNKEIKKINLSGKYKIQNKQ
jgi:hypothetical protein